MQIIYGGDDAFAAAICGIQNPVNRQYFQQQIQHAQELIGDTFGQYGQRFIDGARQMYERYNSAAAVEAAKTVLNQIRGIFQHDIIRSISSITDFQIATPVMQRWIMANPMVREVYHDQRCDGYSDTYVDNAPGAIGEEHYDWRRVMNGVAQFDEKDEVYFNHYAEELDHGDQEELAAEDQFRILDSWHHIQNFMIEGLKDPTSPWNDSL